MKPESTKLGSYSLSMKVLHWGMALLLFSLILAGLSMVRSLEPWQLTLLHLHKSLGIIAFLAILIRLTVRLCSEIPALNRGGSPIQRFVAKLSHILLYAAMLVMPMSGYLMQNAAGRPIYLFDFWVIPAIAPINLELYGLYREVHGITAFCLIFLILIHIGAALYHGMVRRDGVLRSMTINR